jgi:3'(2'), 5'-bisphosphate nucleotidase
MLNKVIAIAEQAGTLIMEYYKKKLTITSKSADRFDPVTKADIEADAYIRKQLQIHFPEDALLSEEHEDVPLSNEGRIWIIDPLDGTRSFVSHEDGFTVMIGLADNGVCILGVVYAPAKNELYYAVKGQGAFRKKGGQVEPLQVSGIQHLKNASIIVSRHRKTAEPYSYVIDLLPVKTLIPEGSAGLKMCKVASGEADTYIHGSSGVSKWDTCSAQCILEEAGGKVSSIFGEKLDYLQDGVSWLHSVVASNGILHPELLEEIKNKL